MKQLESDIRSRQEQALASSRCFASSATKSMIDVTREKQRIAQTKLLAPITGLVAIRQNRAGFFSFGQQLPDIREGDTLQPGMPVADVLDLSELEVVAKVGELDRANCAKGRRPCSRRHTGQALHGKIKSMSGTAAPSIFAAIRQEVRRGLFDRHEAAADRLGIKPADVNKIMATAEANAKKNVVNTASTFFASLQGGLPGRAGSARCAGCCPRDARGSGRRSGWSAGRRRSERRRAGWWRPSRQSRRRWRRR